MIRLGIGIPTLNRYDLLQRSLKTLLPQADNFTKLVIVDNGNQKINADHHKMEVILNKENLGVSGSWNQILNHFNKSGDTDYVLMLNDDIALSTNQVKSIQEFIDNNQSKKMIVGPYYWSAWAMSVDFLPTIQYEPEKYFDESFFPAYYEDNDFYRRVNLIDPSLYLGDAQVLLPEIRENSMTMRKAMPKSVHSGGSRSYYIKKWGGPPRQEKFNKPFNKQPPPEDLSKLKEVFVLYGRTPKIVDTVTSIRRHHGDVDIVVFTNANIKIDDVRVEPHDTFMTGAIWRGYEMFPDKDFYYFLNEYVVLRKDIKFAKANDVSSIAHFPGGFDGEDQSNWLKGNYKDQEFMNMVNSKNWDGVYSSMFACKKHVLHRLVDIGFNTIIPNNIVESQSMERGWGIMFKKLGMDHTASSVCGNFFACLKQPKTRNMLFNITGNGG